MTKKKRPKAARKVSLDDVRLHTFFERDERYVCLEDGAGRTIVEWRDDAYDEAVEDGHLDPRDLRASAYEYAVHVGLVRR